MLTSKLRFTLLLILFLSVFVSSVHSQKSTARFLLWQPSARSVSMGGVGAALLDNSFAVYYNPAGLAFSKGLDVFGSFVKPFSFFDNTMHSLSGVSIPVKDFGTLAIAANRFWREGQAFRNEANTDLGVDGKKFNFFKSTHWEVKLSYATMINKNLSVGLNLSYLRIKLADVEVGAQRGVGKANAVLFGGGFLVKNILPNTTFNPQQKQPRNLFGKNLDIHQGFSVGFSILNAGSQITFINDSQKDNPPTLASLGFTYWPVSSEAYSLMLSTDFEKQIFESSTLDYIHLGGEFRYLLFSIRSGYFLDTEAPSTSYLAYGGGLNFKSLTLNVARYKLSLVSTWHFDGILSVEL